MTEKNKERPVVSEKKKQRIQRAVKLYYGEDLTQEEVAEKMGLGDRTVHRYLQSDYAEEVSSPYSRKEEQELQKLIEDKIEKFDKISESVVGEALKQNDTRVKIKALREFRKSTTKLVDVLHSVGVFEKRAERMELDHSGEVTVEFNESVIEQEEDDE